MISTRRLGGGVRVAQGRLLRLPATGRAAVHILVPR
jgi:hypothetical protein